MEIVNRVEIPEGTRFVDREVFRDVIGHFASGVTVITTRYEEVNYGLTASAVSSLSLDPPMVLVCINKRTCTQKVIAKAKVFAVNILREDQQAIARQFATPHPDKFRDIPIVFGELGVPLLANMLATIECRLVGEVTGGTHAVFLAEVQAAHAEEGMPLAYYRGRMGKFVFSPNEGKAPLWRDVSQWEDYY
jgi:4-nitrophenol 2-monooxygenase / 4-nitrocatechol 4-monooxygenase, reductase component